MIDCAKCPVVDNYETRLKVLTKELEKSMQENDRLNKLLIIANEQIEQVIEILKTVANNQ